jgi:hypothetical protein
LVQAELMLKPLVPLRPAHTAPPAVLERLQHWQLVLQQAPRRHPPRFLLVQQQLPVLLGALTGGDVLLPWCLGHDPALVSAGGWSSWTPHLTGRCAPVPWSGASCTALVHVYRGVGLLQLLRAAVKSVLCPCLHLHPHLRRPACHHPPSSKCHRRNRQRPAIAVQAVKA